jgi:hypothetical protein
MLPRVIVHLSRALLTPNEDKNENEKRLHLPAHFADDEVGCREPELKARRERDGAERAMRRDPDIIRSVKQFKFKQARCGSN